MVPDEDVRINLTLDEALVLDDLLQGLGDQGVLPIVHPSQRRALWNLACLLESALVAPFKPDYRERLDAAKRNLTD